VLTDPAPLAGLGDTLWAVVDDGDAVVEADETNNTA
jgi:subtilase family serine protease